MLFKTAFALLILWLLGMFGVYRVGDLTHIFLLVGRMLLFPPCSRRTPALRHPVRRLRTDDPYTFQARSLHLRQLAVAPRRDDRGRGVGQSRSRQLRPVTHPLHFWVNDVGMVFFFALAAKEVFEATLPGGPLASPRQAMAPLAAAVGGMIAPALIYLALFAVGPAELSRGWAIPCATDIAFSAMIARVIFRPGHPAIPFLLLLAIADDALGLLILAVFYPSGPLSVAALAILMTAAVLAALWLKRRDVRSFWPYLLGPGSLSWAALYFGGFHPALALVPIVPFMPHGRVILVCSIPEKISRSIRSTSSNTGGRRRCSSCCSSLVWRMPASRSRRSGRAPTSCWLDCCSASRSVSCCSPAPLG